MDGGSVTRRVSGFARSDVELSLTYGLTPSVQAVKKSSDDKKEAVPPGAASFSARGGTFRVAYL